VVRRQRNLGLWLGYFFYSHDPRFKTVSLIHRDLWNSEREILISVNRDLDFFISSEIREQKPPPPFKVFVYGKGVQNRYKFTNIFFFFNFHLYFLRGIRLSCLPLNCHYHQISFVLKQVVPFSYYSTSTVEYEHFNFTISSLGNWHMDFFMGLDVYI
jgi:hypothetical protein